MLGRVGIHRIRFFTRVSPFIPAAFAVWAGPMKKCNASASSLLPVESLEQRRLFSAGIAFHSAPLAPSATPALVSHAKAAAPATRVTLKVTGQGSFFASGVTITATVKSNVRGTAPAGTVRFLNGGNPIAIDANGNPLALALGSDGKASYTFGVSNVTLLPTQDPISAVYTSSNSLPGSSSKTVVVKIKTPKFVTKSDGLQISTVKKGTGTATLAAGRTARVVYTGLLASNGKIFDYTNAHGSSSGPFSFTVQSSPEQVIPGFDEGVVGMKVGEIRVLSLPANLGYGSRGIPPTIPANAALIFSIKLLSIS